MNDTKRNKERAAQADEAQNNTEQLQAENARLKEELRREHEIYLRNMDDFDTKKGVA